MLRRIGTALAVTGAVLFGAASMYLAVVSVDDGTPMRLALLAGSVVYSVLATWLSSDAGWIGKNHG